MNQDFNPIILSSIPNLCFVSIENLCLHERFDDTRHHPLAQRMIREGILRNPPIIMQLKNDGRMFLVLDGANRITALKSLGIYHVPVQIVDPDDSGVVLENWNHIVWKITPEDLLERIKTIPNLRLRRFERNLSPFNGDHNHAHVVLANKKIYRISSESRDLGHSVKWLNTIVDSYIDCARVDRTCFQGVEALNGDYPRLGGLIVFPSFSIHEILQIGNAGLMLPTGITRFIVSPRVMGINYPLAKLDDQKSLEEKNIELQEWVRSSFSRKRVRYYPEATFVFDE